MSRPSLTTGNSLTALVKESRAFNGTSVPGSYLRVIFKLQLLGRWSLVVYGVSVVQVNQLRGYYKSIQQSTAPDENAFELPLSVL